MPPRRPRRDPSLFGEGVGATVLGGVAVVTGLSLVVLGTSDRPTPYWPAAKDDGVVAAGVITAGAGAVLLAVGIALVVHSGKRLPPPTSAPLHASSSGPALSF